MKPYVVSQSKWAPKQEIILFYLPIPIHAILQRYHDKIPI